MIEPRQIPVTRGKLENLFPDAEWHGEPPGLLTAIADDSREVVEGGAFVAIMGLNTDGHLFLKQAVEAGAALIVVALDHVKAHPELLQPVEGIPQIHVADTRKAASKLAAAFYANPSNAAAVHGVTGTKGKTTTVHLIADILAAAGRKPATMGTLGIEFGEEKIKTDLTTPGPIEIHRNMRALVDSGATDIACEVSAHAGAMLRTSDVRFETVTYMNLSRDHYNHFSAEEYLDAKLAIARDAVAINPQVWGIGNAGDEHTEAFLMPIDPARRLTFAAYDESEETGEAEINLTGKILGSSLGELRLIFSSSGWEREILLPLVGRFNAENACAAATVAIAMGIDPDTIAAGLQNARPIPGRLERVDLGQNFLVVVDYAHAPQPAREVLTCLQDLTKGRLIAVMGAGGSRDRGKRPLIGEVLARSCDIAVVTSDNPRDEEPLDIINDIMVGFTRAPEKRAEVFVEVDRRKAIERALEQAQAGDTVAVLGKGHEDYQIFKDRTIHFDDREVSQEWLKNHGYAGID